jgi:hypothetical protein
MQFRPDLLLLGNHKKLISAVRLQPEKSIFRMLGDGETPIETSKCARTRTTHAATEDCHERDDWYEPAHLLPNAPGQPRRTPDTEVEKDIVEALRCDRWFGLLLLCFRGSEL